MELICGFDEKIKRTTKEIPTFLNPNSIPNLNT
jgi:hypothetical protein